MDLEDKIAKIIKDEYAPDGYEDEGCSTAAAHNIMNLLRQTKEHENVALRSAIEDALDLLSDGPGGPRRITAMKLLSGALA